MYFTIRATRLPPALSLGLLFALSLFGFLLCVRLLYAGGFDHVVEYDNSGIWKRTNQQALLYTLIGGEIAGAVWLGGEDRLGKTFWQAIDSSALGAVSSEAMKHIFTRSRPDQSPDPNLWFQGGGHYSFPSGEVTAVTAIVTPFVLEYGREHPAVYALELLPAYDAIARVKVHAHWQTDVLAGFALGTGTGWLAHTRDSPVILSVLPHGFMVGLHRQF
jgi:membrane-associated phospholipid phosphatase